MDVGSLRDPEHDNVRCKEPKWLIVLGVCTHLGCVPIADAGRYFLIVSFMEREADG